MRRYTSASGRRWGNSLRTSSSTWATQSRAAMMPRPKLSGGLCIPFGTKTSARNISRRATMIFGRPHREGPLKSKPDIPHFTVLDNSQTENLSEEQIGFLDRDLAASKDRDPKFVFFHKPFWLVPVMFKSGEFPFHQLIKKYGV